MWNSFAHVGGSGKRVASSSAATGVLLVVLLSFGLLFPQLTAPLARGLKSGPVRVLHDKFSPMQSAVSDATLAGGAADTPGARRLLNVPEEPICAVSQQPLSTLVTIPSTLQLNATMCALIKTGEYRPHTSQLAQALKMCAASA